MSHTGTSSLLSGSAGGPAGWSDQQRPGYSVDMQRGALLRKRKKQKKKLLASGKYFINRPKALSSGHCFSNDQQITNKRRNTTLT